MKLNKKEIKVGLVGLGTVGSGTAEILLKQASLLSKKIGAKLVLEKVCDRSAQNAKRLKIPSHRVVSDWKNVVQDPSIDIVVELIGGTKIAREVVVEALKQGKHVVTANKALLALHGKEIFKLATQKNLHICFEASVGGGIPILRSLREGYVANQIKSILGIINGTCNYILSEMTEKGGDFSVVLKKAQDLGYAEKDPSFDIDGVDAAHKLSILLSIAHGVHVPFKKIYIEGIRNISALDIECGKKFGYVIKLLGIAKKSGEELEARVHPCMIPQTNPLAAVGDAFNAILIEGDYVGPGLLYGRGAGRNPTASAVVGDIVEIARSLSQGNKACVPPLGFMPQEIGEAKIRDMKDLRSEYYLRFSVKDVPGILAKITALLSQHKISISSVYQHVYDEGKLVPIVIFTHQAKENDVLKALKRIDRLSEIKSKTHFIRVEKS